jgi:hypothetical protein
MSDSISNVRNTPSTQPVGRVRRPSKDEKSGEQEAERRKPAPYIEDGESTDGVLDEDKPLLDEYA